MESRTCTCGRWTEANPCPERTAIVPAGTPNRKKLQARLDYESGYAGARKAWSEAHATERFICPECKAERIEFERHVQTIAADRRRRTDAARALRPWVLRRLRKMGFVREHTSGKSAYYYHAQAPDFCVRVSDHEVPLSNERSYNRETPGRHTWADSWRSLVLDSRMDFCAAARWLVEIRREVRRLGERT